MRTTRRLVRTMDAPFADAGCARDRRRPAALGNGDQSPYSLGRGARASSCFRQGRARRRVVLTTRRQFSSPSSCASARSGARSVRIRLRGARAARDHRASESRVVPKISGRWAPPRFVRLVPSPRGVPLSIDVRTRRGATRSLRGYFFRPGVGHARRARPSKIGVALLEARARPKAPSDAGRARSRSRSPRTCPPGGGGDSATRSSAVRSPGLGHAGARSQRSERSFSTSSRGDPSISDDGGRTLVAFWKAFGCSRDPRWPCRCGALRSRVRRVRGVRSCRRVRLPDAARRPSRASTSRNWSFVRVTARDIVAPPGDHLRPEGRRRSMDALVARAWTARRSRQRRPTRHWRNERAPGLPSIRAMISRSHHSASDPSTTSLPTEALRRFGRGARRAYAGSSSTRLPI
jgi:hypothetical protein